MAINELRAIDTFAKAVALGSIRRARISRTDFESNESRKLLASQLRHHVR